MNHRSSGRRRRLRWGRILAAAFCLFLLLILAAGALSPAFRQRVGEESASAVSSALPAEGTGPSSAPETLPEGELQGIVRDALMHTLLLEAADGRRYELNTDGAKWSTGENGLLTGSRVTVRYAGVLDPEQEAQKVRVLSVAVESPEDSVPAEKDPAAAQLLAGMTLEEKVGQMFIARCPEEDAAQKAAEYHLGGYLLFGRDFAGRTAEQVAQEIASCQEAAGVPLLIGVDEEGGTVNRVSRNPALRSEPFPSPQELYRQGGLEAVRSDAAEKSRLLRSLGINLNFAPVCDISENPADFIYDRTIGQDAAGTVRYVQTVVAAMREEGMGSVLKHFPGYGSNADTHTGIARDSRPLETFRSADFLPFAAGTAAGAEAVLVSHNIVACMDSRHPASLSPEVHRILREELGFSGVVLTDDLSMEGVRDFTGDEEAAVLAVEAGNDLLCCTNFETQVPAVLEAVREGRIAESRIDESVLRILQMKESLGLLPEIA